MIVTLETLGIKMKNQILRSKIDIPCRNGYFFLGDFFPVFFGFPPKSEHTIKIKSDVYDFSLRDKFLLILL